MSEYITGLLGEVKSRIPGAQTVEPSPVKDHTTLRVANKSELLPLISFLKDKGFEYLDFVTAVDWKGTVSLNGFIREPNPNPFLPEGAVPQTLPKPVAGFPYRDTMEVVYALSNWKEKARVVVRIEMPRANPSVPSVASLFKTADWQERETFDLFGINFEGHPNMIKILTPDCIQGNPLRKDYVHVKDKYD